MRKMRLNLPCRRWLQSPQMDMRSDHRPSCLHRTGQDKSSQTHGAYRMQNIPLSWEGASGTSFPIRKQVTEQQAENGSTVHSRFSSLSISRGMFVFQEKEIPLCVTSCYISDLFKRVENSSSSSKTLFY